MGRGSSVAASPPPSCACGGGLLYGCASPAQHSALARHEHIIVSGQKMTQLRCQFSLRHTHTMCRCAEGFDSRSALFQHLRAPSAACAALAVPGEPIALAAARDDAGAQQRRETALLVGRVSSKPSHLTVLCSRV